jgi:hypothetical protein
MLALGADWIARGCPGRLETLGTSPNAEYCAWSADCALLIACRAIDIDLAFMSPGA